MNSIYLGTGAYFTYKTNLCSLGFFMSLFPDLSGDFERSFLIFIILGLLFYLRFFHSQILGSQNDEEDENQESNGGWNGRRNGYVDDDAERLLYERLGSLDMMSPRDNSGRINSELPSEGGKLILRISPALRELRQKYPYLGKLAGHGQFCRGGALRIAAAWDWLKGR